MATSRKKIRAHSPADPADWELVWNDEFEGNQIDPAKWDYEIGNGFFDYRSHTWVPGWGNEELQYYTDNAANASVKDSVLTIRAKPESLHGCGYTSARLRTRKRDGTVLFAQAYGRFEFRAQVPWGKGLWPALWMLPVENAYGGWAASGEIDLMEIHGEKPHEVLNSIHYGSPYPKRTLHTHVHPLPNDSSVSDWHVYSVEWEPGEIRFYVDDVHTSTESFWWSCSKLKDGLGLEATKESELNAWPAPFDRPFYLLMNVAVGGNFPGAPNPQTQFPAELRVDYVRVFEKAEGYGATKLRGKGVFPWQVLPAPKAKPARKTPKSPKSVSKTRAKPQ
jgi:beta-glucanase (GH16 family)